jgi:8-oxo-dGTP pyrophosphatase MutT (NUDIX family)
MPLEIALDDVELAQLARVWGPPVLQRTCLTVDDPFLTGEHQLLTRGRRAEICYVMHRGRPHDGLLLHIKTFYPEGAFRLPTGGVEMGEGVVDTLGREIYEETGLTVGDGKANVQVERLLGILDYDLRHRQLGAVRFATYHFLVRMPDGAVLDPQDEDESIGGWEWCPPAALLKVAKVLEDVHLRSTIWADWGHFRALSHRFVAEQLGQGTGE